MPAVWFYLAVYTVQLIGAFAVVAAVAGPTAAGSPLSDYEGLSRRAPFLAAVLALFMLAMSGVPLTAGFVGKFGVFVAAWTTGLGYMAATVFYQSAIFARHPGVSLAWISAMLAIFAFVVLMMRYRAQRDFVTVSLASENA